MPERADEELKRAVYEDIKRGKTQQEVADKHGVSKSSVVRWSTELGSAQAKKRINGIAKQAAAESQNGHATKQSNGHAAASSNGDATIPLRERIAVLEATCRRQRLVIDTLLGDRE